MPHARATVIRVNDVQTSDPRNTEIDTILSLLDRFSLDRAYELKGGFIQNNACDGEGNWLDGVVNACRFFGDFIGYTRSFSITTNDPALIDRLARAIHKNRLGEGYKRQTPPYDETKLVIDRKRFAPTNGEVALYYEGQFLGWFDDHISPTITEDGCSWHGMDDGYWHYKAKRELSQRHYDEHVADRPQAKAA